ncbi:hypothetical protein BKA93DRAFT_828871 [Sparassis latifolia]
MPHSKADYDYPMSEGEREHREFEDHTHMHRSESREGGVRRPRSESPGEVTVRLPTPIRLPWRYKEELHSILHDRGCLTCDKYADHVKDHGKVSKAYKDAVHDLELTVGKRQRDQAYNAGYLHGIDEGQAMAAQANRDDLIIQLNKHIAELEDIVEQTNASRARFTFSYPVGGSSSVGGGPSHNIDHHAPVIFTAKPTVQSTGASAKSRPTSMPVSIAKLDRMIKDAMVPNHWRSAEALQHWLQEAQPALLANQSTPVQRYLQKMWHAPEWFNPETRTPFWNDSCATWVNYLTTNPKKEVMGLIRVGENGLFNEESFRIIHGVHLLADVQVKMSINRRTHRANVLARLQELFQDPQAYARELKAAGTTIASVLKLQPIPESNNYRLRDVAIHCAKCSVTMQMAQDALSVWARETLPGPNAEAAPEQPAPGPSNIAPTAADSTQDGHATIVGDPVGNTPTEPVPRQDAVMTDVNPAAVNGNPA